MIRHGAGNPGDLRVGATRVARMYRGASPVWEHGTVYAQSASSALPIPRSPYPPPPAAKLQKRDDMAVVVAFFSPSGYKRPAQYFADTLASLGGAGIPAVALQVVRPGQNPLPVPQSVKSLVLQSSHVLFRKENLWNIGARAMPHGKLLFMDSDVTYSSPHWYDLASQELDSVDVIQPYDWCQWEAEDGTMSHGKFPAAVPISQGHAPRLDRYHPGFAWGMTRRAYDALGGIYDRDVAGGGDVALAFSMAGTEDWVMEHTHRKSGCSVAVKTPSWLRYRRNAMSLGLRVAYVPNVVLSHRWHGNYIHRKYHDRGLFLPERTADGEYPLHYRDDGLLEWDDESASDLMQQYFDGRKEDG